MILTSNEIHYYARQLTIYSYCWCICTLRLHRERKSETHLYRSRYIVVVGFIKSVVTRVHRMLIASLKGTFFNARV